jgi:glycosyltransferase involved in cell wall biosynthesis
MSISAGGSGAGSSRPVAVVLSRFPVVTQTFIVRELDELERQGMRVILVPLLRGRDAVVHREAEPWTRRALSAPLLNFRILAENLRVLLRRPGRYLSTWLGMAWDLRTHPKDLLALLTLFPKSVWLGRRLRGFGVRHVHAQFATHAAAAAYVMSRVHADTGSDLPFSVTVHGSDLFIHQAGLARKLGAAEFVRVISEYGARFLLERLGSHLDADRVRVIHCGVDPNRFEREPGSGRAGFERHARVVSIAALLPNKGVRYLVEAIAQLRAESLDVHCDVIGEGPRRGELERRIRRSGLLGVMRLVGNCPEEEVAQALSTADLFVLASVVSADGKREGIPVSLMEAMATGLPVVATRLAGIPELVVDGSTGRLVEPGNSVALARAIRAILEDPPGSGALAVAAREKVRAEFTLSECGRGLASEIDAHSLAPRED